VNKTTGAVAWAPEVHSNKTITRIQAENAFSMWHGARIGAASVDSKAEAWLSIS
jgi:hypothetical protein